MPMFPRLELEKVFLHDAQEILGARELGKVIHRTKDIRACGNEVEQVVRDVLKRKLARTYYVGHGHIVDTTLSTSPQLDVIVSDNANTPVLFKAEDGTEYMPYESVYAIGEVKSTYSRSSKPIEAFVDTLRATQSQLKRENVSKNYLGSSIELGDGFTSGIRQPFRNPLFSFMLFADAGDMDLDQLATLYKGIPDNTLPSVICFLDKGTLVNTRLTNNADARLLGLKSINIHPVFNAPETNNELNRWVLFPVSEDRGTGHAFALLCFALMAHLNLSVLKPPDMTAYFNQMFLSSTSAHSAQVLNLQP